MSNSEQYTLKFLILWYTFDLRFNQPNLKAKEKIELLLLEALVALESNDFVDEIEYLRVLIMTVIVSSCYCEMVFFSNPAGTVEQGRLGGL